MKILVGDTTHLAEHWWRSRAHAGTRWLLPTGATPLALYERAQHWLPTIEAAQLDDYIDLSQDAPERFSAVLQRALPAVEFFTIDEPTETNFAQYHRFASNADGLILGVGRNGRLAFNEPGSLAISTTRCIQIHHITADDLSQSWTSDEPIPQWGWTIGMREILAVPEILLIALGAVKGPAIAALMREDVRWPIAYLAQHRDVTVVLDQSCADAAGLG